ncbi:hypothetical protein RM863_18085 [Streptomyces sp. DSM 41014]|uniref:Uncharacterized protein n=1 Tax=Streptomyces hintoniae TaxID=3075521 RepID=A0ABU2ULT1_9ACTN|nr:hypothetical protein [Streptomyces sp. DSM 41014]MDT0474040.1 hypothetical protein [Streptomyces sp. DSM 41014]
MSVVTGELPLPELLSAPTLFDEMGRLLLRAYALRDAASANAIARHAGIDQFDIPGNTARLLAKAGADNETHLIRLRHAYGLLTTVDVSTPPPT